jgi:hypothetical protein
MIKLVTKACLNSKLYYSLAFSSIFIYTKSSVSLYKSVTGSYSVIGKILYSKLVPTLFFI